MDELAVNFDVIARGRLHAEIRARSAIDGDASGGDQLIAMAARTDSGRGEEAI